MTALKDNNQAAAIVKVAKGIVHWLEFERCAGRDGRFSENALYEPVYHVLHAPFPNEVSIDHAHSALNAKREKTNSLRIDCWVAAPKTALELKWVNDKTNTTTGPKGWIKDAARLATISESDPDTLCFFALVGTEGHVDNVMSTSRKDGPPKQKKGLDSARVDCRWFHTDQSWKTWDREFVKHIADSANLKPDVQIRHVVTYPDGANRDVYTARIWEVKHV